MKLIAAFSAALIVSSLQAEDKDVIRDKSPDGKFALQITKDEQGRSAAVIDVKSKANVVDLDVYQNFTEEMHLVWSKDSQRVAYFEPDRRGGSTTVYFRNGDKFEAVELPEFPECQIRAAKGETVVKAIESTTKPQKWLGSGGLMLKEHSDVLIEKGDNQFSRTCTQIVTVVFDSSHKASVQSAKKIKSD